MNELYSSWQASRGVADGTSKRTASGDKRATARTETDVTRHRASAAPPG